MIRIQQAVKSFMAFDLSGNCTDLYREIDKIVFQALAIAFSLIVLDEIVDGSIR
ncbi:MAG: hypothetical protein GY826_31935 [Fuerstiella sp.]|jgi:hypothetical protein|nr:hypothetical protein [Fuerstiella sp.]